MAKRIAAANASMGAMSNIWEDNYVELYSKYLLFQAIPCNLLMWGCESWALRKTLLDSLEVFLHRGLRRILRIKMSQVIDQHIKNASIREKLYNITTIKNQIGFQKLTYLGKIFHCEASHILTRLLTAWCDHLRKKRHPLLTNKQSIVMNIQLVLPEVNRRELLSKWGFHTLDAQHWNNLLNTLKHSSYEAPKDPPNLPS